MTSKLVAESASAAIATVGRDDFARLTSVVVKDVGADFVQHLTSSDEPGVLSPISLEFLGKACPGAILVLADRVIIAWTMGRIRRKRGQAIIPRDAIDSIEESKSRDSRAVLYIKGDGTTWKLTFSSVAPQLAFFIKEVLEGHITPAFGQQPDESSA